MLRALFRPRFVRALDAWQAGSHGAVLFWIDIEIDPLGTGLPVLHQVGLDYAEGHWRMTSSGGADTDGVELLHKLGDGIHRIGGASWNGVRTIEAWTSPTIAVIELHDDHRTWSRSPGIDGFCLFGVTVDDPITHAHPLGDDGQPRGRPLLL